MSEGKWMDVHYERIERLGVQFGLSLDAAFQVALDTFVSLRDDPKKSELLLYTYAVEKMKELQPAVPFLQDIFLFKEDVELHSRIVALEVEFRIPLILSSFHKLDNEQIGAILEETLGDVEVLIQKAKSELGENQLEKRLELLEKSYNRLPVQFTSDRIVGSTPAPEAKKAKSAKGLIAVGILLIGILTATFFLPDKEVAEIVAPSNSKFEVEYKEVREQYQEVLRLTNERFNKLGFVKEADKQMALFKKNEDAHSDTELEAEFEKVLEELMIPSEMLVGVSSNSSLMDDEQASIAFLTAYRAKIKDLLVLYDEILWDYRTEIENFEVQGYLNKVDRLREKANAFPEELKNILLTMQDQSIELAENQNTGEIRAKYFASDGYSGIQWNFHSNTYGYVYMLTIEQLVVDGMLFHSSPDSYYNLLVMEGTLANATKDEVLYPALEAMYLSFFHHLIKGSSTEDVFDQDGFVRGEYRDAWRRISDMHGAQPSNYLLLPIVEEMEASGWRHSTTWDGFSKETITETLVLARMGELERLMYGDPPVVRDDSVTFPNEEFFSQVKQLYNEFKGTYDIGVFKGVSPLLTIGVFDYGNEMEDPATMYHLLREGFDEYSETGITQSLEEYVASWRKGFSIFKDANRIDFLAASMQRMKRDFSAYIDVQSTNMTRGFSIYLNEEGNWYMDGPIHEPLPSSQNEAEVAINTRFKSEIQDLYQSFSAHHDSYPLEGLAASQVIGLYLYAGGLRDYKTQYALLWKGRNLDSVNKEEFLKQSEHAPSYKMEDLFTTISFNAKKQDANGDWFGVATLTDNNEEGSTQSLRMIWKDRIWRVVLD